MKSRKFRNFVKMRLKYIIGALIALAMGCARENVVIDPNWNASVFFETQQHWGSNNQPFQLSTWLVHQSTGDSLKFNRFRFYLSNVALQKEDGTWWVEPNSYRLIDMADTASLRFEVKDVPPGIYQSIKYTLGVDSLRNVSGVQTGALDPVLGMFWTWNSGYIMLKAEGQSPQSPDGSFSYHLGGFAGKWNVVTTREHAVTLMVGMPSFPTVVLAGQPDLLLHPIQGVQTYNALTTPGDKTTEMAKAYFSGYYIKDIRP
jgi:hypothetical protein